jgi:uncharacterized C2H2 Zn-finger protein
MAWLSLRGHAEGQLESPHRREAVRSVDLIQFPLAHESFSSGGPKYRCPDCSDAFGDAAARIRHRKSAHGYEPYHTEEYLARQSLKGREGVAQGPGKAVPNKTRRQRAASAAPYSLPHSPSSDARPAKLRKVTYHNNFWKTLVNTAWTHAENPEPLQEIQVGLPATTNPGSHTATQPLPDISIQPVAQMPPSLPPSSDGSDFFGFQLDAMSPQVQAFAGPSTQDNTAAYPVTSGYASLLSSTGVDATAFTSGCPPTYSGVGFVNQPQELPMYSYGDATSLMPEAVTAPSTYTSPSPPSVDFQPPLTHGSYEPAALFEPVPQAGPSWSPASSQAITASLSQFDDFLAPGQTIDFDTWYQSNLIAPGLSSHF